MSRPELSGPPEEFYDAKEARKYTSSSRIINIQKEIADRCIELLNIPQGERRLILDIGCGSGLSGAALEAAGHAWIGSDISSDMLRIAGERAEEIEDQSEEEDDESFMEEDDDSSYSEDADEDMDEAPAEKRRCRRVDAVASTELIQHDMGLGLPFRDGTFDAAISVSALQWLCYDNASDQSAPKRLGRFFSSLYRCLKRSSRAALQFYPQNDHQATLIASAASKAGFSGGIVIDFPNSSKARKHYLCLSMDRGYRKPSAKTEEVQHGHQTVATTFTSHTSKKKRGSATMKKGDRDWLLAKKDFQRKQGRQVRPDTKYTGRKRKDRF